MSKKRRTLKFSIADIQGSDTKLERILKDLRRRQEYNENLLFMGFNGERIETLLKEGLPIKNNDVFMATEAEIRNPVMHTRSQIFRYAEEHFIPAVAIYSGLKMKRVCSVGYEYEFINPDNKKDSMVE